MRLSISILSLLLFLGNFCFGQQTKEQKFKAALREIIDAFSVQDSIAISKYINDEIGVYQLDRIGVFDNYNHFKAISFSDTTYPQVYFVNQKTYSDLFLNILFFQHGTAIKKFGVKGVYL